MTCKKNETQVKNLQMVEIDHNKFAVELKDGNVSVNLTKMAKPFGKKPSDWIRTQPAKDYLEALNVSHICATADLVQVRQGGTKDEQGTWATDYRVAMRFAQWLSVEFSIQVDELLVNMVKGENKPLHLPQYASKPEGKPYPCRMGSKMTDCYYTGGVIYTRFTLLLNYLGNPSGLTPASRLKLGAENFILVPTGGIEIWYGNHQAFLNYFETAKIKPDFVQFNNASRDIWGITASLNNNDVDDQFTYKFTDSEMNQIFITLMKSRVSKSEVVGLLSKGKLEGGRS